MGATGRLHFSAVEKSPRKFVSWPGPLGPRLSEMPQPAAAFPVRTSLCLDCRTATTANAPCPHGHGAGRVRSLRTRPDREQVLLAAWGPPEHRDRLRRAGVAGAAGVASCSSCNIGEGIGVALEALIDPLVLLVLVVAVVGTFVGWLLARPLAWRWRKRSAKLAPLAAIDEPTPLGAGPGLRGQVMPGSRERDEPLTQSPCVAFAARLRHQASGTVMLRDGATVGFELVLGSGERVWVPPGDCVLEAPRSPERQLLASSYVRQIDALGGADNDLDPFLHDQVELVTLRPGDEVELLSEVTTQPDPAPQRWGFRAGASLLTAAAPVRLRLVRQAG